MWTMKVPTQPLPRKEFIFHNSNMLPSPIEYYTIKSRIFKVSSQLIFQEVFRNTQMYISTLLKRILLFVYRWRKMLLAFRLCSELLPYHVIQWLFVISNIEMMVEAIDFLS